MKKEYPMLVIVKADSIAALRRFEEELFTGMDKDGIYVKTVIGIIQ